MFLAFQVIVDTFSEGAGTFSVNNADGSQRQKRSVPDDGISQQDQMLLPSYLHFPERMPAQEPVCGNRRGRRLW